MTTNYAELYAAMIADPSTTYWLRDAMSALELRDPVDALNDVEALLRLATLRAQAVTSHASK